MKVVYTVSNQSIYTVSDVVNGWAPDRSMRILSSPNQYNNSILYKFLTSHTRVNGIPWKEEHVELLKGTFWKCGKWTRNCIVGSKNSTFPSHNITRIPFLRNISNYTVVTFRHNDTIAFLSNLLPLKTHLNPNQVSMHLRIGDKREMLSPKYSTLMYKNIEERLLHFPKSYFELYATMQFVNFDVQYGRTFEFQNSKLLQHELFLMKMTRYFASRNVSFRFAQTQNVDEDLIQMINSRWFIPTVGGFSKLIDDIRMFRRRRKKP